MIHFSPTSSGYSTPFSMGGQLQCVQPQVHLVSMAFTSPVSIFRQSRGTSFCSHRKPFRVRCPPKMFIPLTLQSNDAVLTAGALTLASSLVGAASALRSRGILSGRAARKTVHAAAGVAYLILWSWYNSRWFALVVPLSALAVTVSASGLLTGIVGRGDESSKIEALRGPALYIALLAALTVFEWKSPIAYIAIAQLCFGDAAAEIFGRAFGEGNRWPFAKSKSVAGSTSFIVAGALGSIALLSWYGLQDLITSTVILKLLAVSAACAAAELLPSYIVGDDNIAVVLTAVFISRVLW